MSICNGINLGTFSSCQPIEIDDFDEESQIHNLATGWQCTPDDILFLAPGYYRFEANGNIYEFKVV